MEYFIDKVAQMLAPLVESDAQTVKQSLQITQLKGEGDVSFLCFEYARAIKKDPVFAARELSKKAKSQDLFERVSAKNGYVNFYLKKELIAGEILKKIYDQKNQYGDSTEGQNKTVIVEFSSPNIAKPFGIGHLRSTNIGRALSRIFECLGYKVIKINHLGDWGTQFGKLITAYKKWGNAEILKNQPVIGLYKLYVKFHEEEKNDPSLTDEARDWFSKLEKGDPEAKELWEWFKDLSLVDIRRIYSKLGIEFDHYTGESFYNDKMESTFKRLQEKKIMKRSQDAWIVDLEEENLGVSVIRKKDDSSLYITRDICAAEYRHENYKFDKLYYVVGVPQSLHFKQLFRILELMGYEWYSRCKHIPFGHISFGEEGKGMATREGRIIFLEDVLARARDLARNIVETKNPSLEDKGMVAEMVGIAAIVFADLSSKRIKNVKFDWDEILNFDGETGPYLQYTLVRIKSLGRKYTGVLPRDVDYKVLNKDEEIDLIKTLGRFPLVIKKAASDVEPFLIARYLIDVAKHFNRFYNEHKILDGEENISQSRMALAMCAGYVLERGFSLIGIPVLAEM